MAISARGSQLLKIFLPIIFVLLLTGYLFSDSPRIPIPSTSWGKHTENDYSALKSDAENGRGKKAAFIEAATEWEIDGPYNDRPLRQLCSSKKWVPGLIFKCDPAFGGVGNVRNIVLTCVRYAIEAGATSLILPEITARDPDLIQLQTGKNLPYTYMFDQAYFISSLKGACPKIRIIHHEDDLADVPSASPIVPLTPHELGHDFKVGRVIQFAQIWRSLFDTWLANVGAPYGISANKPALVLIKQALFEYDINSDNAPFTATFGRIVRFREDIRRLSAIVLYAMDKKYKLELNPAPEGIPEAGKFYGGHLRTAIDATNAGFAPYEEQAGAYLDYAHMNNLTVAYVASGSPPDIERISREAGDQGIAVITKNTLLEGDPEFKNALEEMKALSWDQQALIDYAVLMRSSVFGGTWASSFAWNIAFRRHVAVNKGAWVASDTAKKELGLITRGEHAACFEDAISTIFGGAGRGIWFELSMWP